MQQLTRNFSIIAHIDHGKSTLADRLLERTQTISTREMKAQVLDTLDLEQERGITIKLQPARMQHTAADGKTYVLNLIDTPGHVDFTYEVSRSLAACEGALLVVDASQGIEAQTMANIFLALENNLVIIPIINKIDLPSANVEKTRAEITSILGETKMLEVSAKTGLGIDEVLRAIVEEVPSPVGNEQAPLKALIFDSNFDSYRGVVVMVRVIDGSISAGQRIRFMHTKAEYEVTEVGYFTPKKIRTEKIGTGEVGYLVGNIRTIADIRIGDTVTEASRQTGEALQGYKEPKSMVFSGLYPVESEEYPLLREALEKLQLNDSSL